ncbi:restriction endonuclease subunit S [Helicobacter pylori]|uniref:Restriction endonuclease subunit S n=1 Tax=Helicobacter pylori TaxID=210 RepID=A0AAE7AQ21_HELPX|nr:restriction endonuclease subunit S [Helicobacter pylori]QJW28755.1 restriction endonuclease subunit S [Helicobacter pylori A45]QJW40053.1 restriction endonuclease subunit S [Helicobacter pylori]QJW41509.1 restriction endonuclease subunit S [Helicobacter pylori]QJW42963.1 restriction endonuclease subunit S [Helicobacter pylori]
MDALMLPLNWQRVRLGDIAEIKRGASPRPIENPKWFCANSNVGWVRISDISKNSRFLYKTAQKLSKKGIEKSRFIKQNSLIMSMCATIGKPIITKIDTCIHDGFVVFENPKIDLNYLYYFLCYIEKEWLESGQQGSQVNLNVDLIKNKEVFYPKDLNEQIAIANILSDVDRYLYSLDALILKKESVKKALSFELLSQRKRLKGFNQAWQRVRLGDIAEIKRGVRITKNELDVFGKYPVVSGGVGFLGYTNNFNRYENTITIAQYGTAGYVNFQKNKFWANDVCFCVYPSKNVIKNIFLYYFLKVNQNYLYEISNRNATPYSISKDKILDFEIPLPPLDEQIAIANILSALDHKIISLKNKKRQFENIKKALNRDLMSAKIRVLKK